MSGCDCREIWWWSDVDGVDVIEEGGGDYLPWSEPLVAHGRHHEFPVHRLSRFVVEVEAEGLLVCSHVSRTSGRRRNPAVKEEALEAFLDDRHTRCPVVGEMTVCHGQVDASDKAAG